MIARRLERIGAYALLVVIGVIGLAPFVLLAIISFKTRIQVLEVPPSLDIKLEQIVKNYEDVIVDRGFWRYTVNSIIVTASTVVISLLIATPAASRRSPGSPCRCWHRPSSSRRSSGPSTRSARSTWSSA